MKSINQSIQQYNDTLEKSKPVYSGILGLAIDSSKKVNIPTRAGYVYVRLRDNLSEVIQAYNDKVSPVYDFPVLIERRGNKWYITGRDDQRYETFGTSSPFLPQHGDAHSFNRDGGGGGDTVFVYPDQFVPLLVYPSGTTGAGNLMVAPYALQRNSDFVYVGNTGTQNLLVYKPTNAQAIVGLVYLDKTTGNPGVLIASGTPMSGTATGTASVLPYLPYPSSNQEPLYAFRLLSGTTALTWGNLYNVRQFYGGSSSSTGSSGGGISGIVVQDEGVTQGTGTVLNFVGDNVSVSVSGSVARVFVTGSAGSSLPSFITGSIPFAGGNGILTESNEALWWDETYRGFRLGKRNSRFNFADTFPIGITALNQDETISIGLLAYGTGTSGAPSAGINGYRSRGGLLSQTPVKAGDISLFISGRGFDGSTHASHSRINFFAAGDSITGTYNPTGIDLLTIPSGSNTLRSQLTIYGDSVNQPTGSTYNIGGVQHTHAAGDVSGITKVLYNTTLGSASATIDITSIPTGYHMLKLVYYLRHTSTGTDWVLTFNADTGTNYNALKVIISSGGVAPTDVFGAAGVTLNAAASSDSSNYFTSGEATIPNYDGTVGYKTLQVISSRPVSDTAGNQRLFNYQALWKSTSAISRITLTAQSGDTFVAGSRVSLIGYK